MLSVSFLFKRIYFTKIHQYTDRSDKLHYVNRNALQGWWMGRSPGAQVRGVPYRGRLRVNSIYISGVAKEGLA